jgi:hypothetical protein
MAPPPGYNAASVWHKDFPPRELIDNTTDPETGEKVEWRKRGKVQDKEAVAQWFEQHVPSFEPQPMTTEEQKIYRMDAMAYARAGQTHGASRGTQLLHGDFLSAASQDH